MIIIFNSFPREVAWPKRKVVWNEKELMNFIKLSNGKTNCYISVYNFELITQDKYKRNVPVYETAKIDKMYFDLDSKNCYEDCKKFREYCKKENLMYRIVFSGRGYHFYIFVKHSIIEHKKDCLLQAQNHITEILGVDVDKQTQGDLARITRIPNTYNLRRRRFCIPLTKEQFEKGHKFIRELAKKQNKEVNTIYGNKKFDIKPFDKGVNVEVLFLKNMDFNHKIEKEIPEIVKDFPICIKNLIYKIKHSKHSYKERFILILYLREKGYMLSEVLSILKKILPKEKFYHCVKKEGQTQYLFRRDDLMMPNCQEMIRKGVCNKKCDLYGKFCGVYK